MSFLIQISGSTEGGESWIHQVISRQVGNDDVGIVTVVDVLL